MYICDKKYKGKRRISKEPSRKQSQRRDKTDDYIDVTTRELGRKVE